MRLLLTGLEPRAAGARLMPTTTIFVFDCGSPKNRVLRKTTPGTTCLFNNLEIYYPNKIPPQAD